MIDLKPMKMTDVSVTTADQYIADDAWVMEQKHDGARALVSWHWEDPEDMAGIFSWQASGGGPLKFAAAVQHIAAIEEELRILFNTNNVEAIILDGELMIEEGKLRIFDMPYAVFMDDVLAIEPSDPFYMRRDQLDELFTFEHPSARAYPVTQAVDTDAKRLLWERINAAGVEGAMVKRQDAPYEGGVRTKSQLKLKLVKTADVIVTSVERRFDHKGMVTHGSANLAINIRPEQDPAPWRSVVTGKRLTEAAREVLVNGTKAQYARALAHEFDPRKRLPIGAASLIGKDLTIDVGDVVEVNYLYWTGDALVQPRIVRKRTPEEKPADDCWLDQLPVYSRVAVS